MTEIFCPTCKLWFPEAEWVDCETACETCGWHVALKCPECRDKFDEVYDDLDRRGL